MRFTSSLIALFLGFALCCLSAANASAAREVEAATELNAALTHILQQVGKDVRPTFDPQKTTPLLSFLESDKKDDTLYYPAEIDGTTAAYYQFDMDSSMARLLDYAYNDAIPPQALSPSSLRTAYRIDAAAKNGNGSWQWQLPVGNAPQVVRYAEHEEITPDLFTGAYYGYDLDRTLILYRLNGRNVFLSLSRQRDVSDVGKKGVTLGEEGNWDYLYSGETGLNKTGLGWIKSYVYKSFSVTVFYETPGEHPRLRCGSFKWINAGWAGINMVQRKHIHRGLERYASDLEQIIEDRRLPDHSRMADGFSALRRLSTGQLRGYLADYLDSLAKQYAQTKSMSRKTIKEMLAGKKYTELLDRPQMLAVVELEYLKGLLGKQCRLPDLLSLADKISVSMQ